MWKVSGQNELGSVILGISFGNLHIWKNTEVKNLFTEELKETEEPILCKTKQLKIYIGPHSLHQTLFILSGKEWWTKYALIIWLYNILKQNSNADVEPNRKFKLIIWIYHLVSPIINFFSTYLQNLHDV